MSQQMHPGLTVPGGPQVSQAGGPMISGMMPGGAPGVSGAGPSAHALSHLNPHNGPLLAQQQQQMQASECCLLFIESLSFAVVAEVSKITLRDSKC